MLSAAEVERTGGGAVVRFWMPEGAMAALLLPARSWVAMLPRTEHSVLQSSPVGIRLERGAVEDCEPGMA